MEEFLSHIKAPYGATNVRMLDGKGCAFPGKDSGKTG